MSSFTSSRSDATFVSQEGVYFTTRTTSPSSSRRESSTASSTATAPLPRRKWSASSLRSAECQTSVCPVHIEVVATRGGSPSPSSHLLSFLARFCQVWRGREMGCSDYQWGWQQAPAPALVSTDMSSEEVDCNDEAELSGWAHCGVVYGNGNYDMADEWS